MRKWSCDGNGHVRKWSCMEMVMCGNGHVRKRSCEETVT